jgi:hypothetical protein
MSTNCRFTLDENRYVIDTLNPANSGNGCCCDGDPEDDRYLRECVLMVSLSGVIKKLIINLEPMQESLALRTMLYTIRASHLNTFDPALSIQHRFGGKLRRQKEHTQDLTSLALFRDDVECLLRDLYGDVESEALDILAVALLRIVQQFARYVRPDLWKEHQNAEDLDFDVFGIGVPDGYGFGGSDYRHAMAARAGLINRVREVNANPSGFSEYTIEFAKLFGQQWDCSRE